MLRNDEIERALQRVLESKTFATHGVSRKLLARIVADALKGKIGEGYERTLARDIFGRGSGWDPMHDAIVRQSMANMRKHLRAHYESYADEVEIAFERGAGYTPSFQRRPLGEDESLSRLISEFWQEFPELMQCGLIIDKVKAFTAEFPTHAPAFAALAEMLLACAMCDGNDQFLGATLEAREAVENGMRLNQELWRLHVVAGTLHAYRFRWDKADEAFNTALRLAPAEAGTHFWYAAYLLAIGRTEEALQCVSQGPSRGLRACARPLFLYVSRRYQEAYDELRPAREWPVSADVHQHLKLVRRLEMEFEQNGPLHTWLGEILMACVCLALGHGKLGCEYGEAGVVHSKAGAFAGLLMPLALSAKDASLKKRVTRLHLPSRNYGRHGSAVSSIISKVLARMGEGKVDDASEDLYMAFAFDAGSPLVAWAHLWPVLDPMRESPRFIQAIERMNLPQQSLREG